MAGLTESQLQSLFQILGSGSTAAPQTDYFNTNWATVPVTNGSFSSAIQKAMTEAANWGPAQQKYSNRFAEYFVNAQKKLGEPIVAITPEYAAKANTQGGTVFQAQTQSGKKYIIEMPFSPGGKFFDYNTAGMPGWSSLGLGDLGGEGNEKIAGNTMASMIPLEQFRGFDPKTAIYSANVNPSGGSFGLGDALGLAGLAFGGYNLLTGGSGLLGGLGEALGGGWTGTAAELAADGLGGVDMFGGASGLLGSAGGSAMDWGDLFSGLGDTTADWLPNATGWDFGPLSDTLLSGGVDPVSGLTLNQMTPGLLDSITNYVTNNPGSTLKTAMNALTGGANSNILSGLLSGAGGYLTGNSSVDAARTNAAAQIEAAKIAADAAKFRPVGVTTNFGKSTFGFDANGNLSTAGYELTPEMKAQQQALMGTSGNMLSQFQGAQAATAPMGASAQRAMQLGQGYLATDPQAQAAKYLAEQQALLATGRERDLASLQNTLTQQGRIGLATGGTSTGMMAANPELEAYYNALRQQDLQLAANATQGGMDYAKFGAGMVGTGGDLLNSMYGTQQNAFAPYQTALGGAQTIEGLGQNSMTLGMNLGNTATAANAQAGGLLASGMANAANTMQPANSYSPWGAMLTGAGNQMNNYTAQQQQTQLLNSLLGGGTTMFGR